MSKKPNHPNNIRIFAENDGTNPGFIISLSISGQKEYLLHHRHNGLLFQFLKSELTLGELYRYKPAWSRSTSLKRRKRENIRHSKLSNMVRYLIVVIDEYLQARAGALLLLESRVEKQALASRHECIDENELVA